MDATQCRMARSGLGVTARELALHARVAEEELIRFEAGGPIPDSSRLSLLNALVDFGAEFSFSADRVGVTVPK